MRHFLAGILALTASLEAGSSAAQATRVYEAITPPGLEVLRDVYHLSPAVRVGDMLVLSGVIGTEDGTAPGSAEEEYELAWAQILYTLQHAGLGLEHVYEITTYHTDMSGIEAFAVIKDKYIKAPYPAWSAVGVSALAVPGARAEIKVVARFPKK